MLNLDTFVRALKSTWIRRLYLNPKAPWATLATTLLGPLNRLFLLGSSYSTDIARKMGNKFWIDTLRSWSALTEKLGVKNKDLSLPIWNNTNFSNFFLPRWYNAGIVSIGDILNANGDILTETELARTFKIKMNYLEYHRVIRNLKSFCSSTQDRVHTKPICPTQIQILLRSKKGSKDFYDALHKRSIRNQSLYYSFWEQALKINITSKDWKNIYQNCFKTVEDKDLKWFQYRILNRILGTNEYLVKLKYKENPKCNFCKSETENIVHLLFDCHIVKKIWTELNKILQLNLHPDFNFSLPDIILGIICSTHNKISINIIILLAKFYIFKTSRANGQLSQQAFGNFLKEFYINQEFAAKLKDRHSLFIKSWGRIQFLFI